MKTPDCVEMKNKIQAKILRDYESVPRDQWARRQADELAQSRAPIAEFWRHLKPTQRQHAVCVVESNAEYKTGTSTGSGKVEKNE